MYLVGDRVEMPTVIGSVYGTVSRINESPHGEMTYWIDSDDGTVLLPMSNDEEMFQLIDDLSCAFQPTFTH
jgi:hypothetical protein